MTESAQRIAAAEALGWSFIKGDNGKTHWLDQVYLNGEWQCQTSGWVGDCVPNYPSDLNAAITLCDFLAEQGWLVEITNGFFKEWEVEFFREATDETHPDDTGYKEDCRLEIHYAEGTLPAAICQAFLKALKKWDDSK